ncbi:MAG: hypothetical protein PHG79_10600 [Methanosarcina sp.]|jgi:hypothetical protein|nr:hypothetical protein [Methanosarcina sp.]MDD4523623.1 hypothetical protein [Methanosarcina sp.]
MVINDLELELIKGVISLVVTLITLLLGWIVGNKIAYNMSINQKRREIELDQLNQFFQLYGEFFSIWKLYNYLFDNKLVNNDICIELLKRASDAEAGIEAILLKIASDKKLSDEDTKTLGCFRQSYQLLRESIRDKKRINWNSSNHEQYKSFKTLSCKVAHILSENDKGPTEKETIDNFCEITNNKWERKWY